MITVQIMRNRLVQFLRPRQLNQCFRLPRVMGSAQFFPTVQAYSLDGLKIDRIRIQISHQIGA
jgi:hypothetical protein